MPKAYYSIVLEHSAAEVWNVIRPFDHYSWAGVPGETIIEDGKRGDQVGGIRRFSAGGKTIRQQLLAHSDVDRFYTYSFLGEMPVPARNYVATLRVSPISATNQAFVEWSATFDCDLGDSERAVEHFERNGFAIWLAALQKFMMGRP